MLRRPDYNAINVLRFTLIAQNALILAACAGASLYGMLLFQSTELTFATDNKYFSATLLIMISGFATEFIAVVGVLAAWRKYISLLALYILAIGSMSISKVVTSSIIFANLPQIGPRINGQMLDSIKNYALTSDVNYDSDSNNFISNIQYDFRCCGVDGPEDWLIYNLGYVLDIHALPWSCQCMSSDQDSCTVYRLSGDEFHAWSQGCNETYVPFEQENTTAVGATLFPIAMLEMGAAIIACGLLFVFFAKTRHKFPYNLLNRVDDTTVVYTTTTI